MTRSSDASGDRDHRLPPPAGDRFGSYLNSHVHFHVLVTDGVLSAADDSTAVFHPAVSLDSADILAVQAKVRTRGLRWLHRHGHLDSEAVHTLDAPDHAGGWSLDASVTIPGIESTAQQEAPASNRAPDAGNHDIGWCGAGRMLTTGDQCGGHRRRRDREAIPSDGDKSGIRAWKGGLRG